MLTPFVTYLGFFSALLLLILHDRSAALQPMMGLSFREHIVCAVIWLRKYLVACD